MFILKLNRNLGRVTFSTCLNIDGIVLPTVKSARDLGVLVAHDLSPSLHITSIVARAHKRTEAIYRAFHSPTLTYFYGLTSNMFVL